MRKPAAPFPGRMAWPRSADPGVCWSDMAEGEEAMWNCARWASRSPMWSAASFVGWQTALDPAARRVPGTMEDPRFRQARTVSSTLIGPSRCCQRRVQVFIAHVGGAMSRIGDATAIRSVQHYTMNVHTRWRDPGEDALCIGWARPVRHAASYARQCLCKLHAAARRPDRTGLWPTTSALRIKRRYDPGNLFRSTRISRRARADRAPTVTAGMRRGRPRGGHAVSMAGHLFADAVVRMCCYDPSRARGT